MAVCVAAGGLVMSIAVNTFTLVWTHSIEKILWEEDYRVEGRMLVLTEARVRGSGAGMEAPAGSRFERGVWHYDPHLPPLPELRLTHSDYTAGYRICHDATCVPLVDFAPRAGNGDVVEVRPCDP